MTISLENGKIVTYDHLADPLERNPLDDPSRSEEVKALFGILQDWVRAQNALAGSGEEAKPAEIDQETIEELRSLGYID